MSSKNFPHIRNRRDVWGTQKRLKRRLNRRVQKSGKIL